MIRSRVSSRVKRLRAKWVLVIKVMKFIIRHIFALSIGWSTTLRIDRVADKDNNLRDVSQHSLDIID
jgi:hypothetical protein